MSEIPYPFLPVLLVDDEAQWLCSFELTLQAAGIHNVLTCQESREVPNLLDSREIGVIVADMNMPHLSGQELLELVKKNYPEIPVIIITGMNEVELAVQCMKVGAADYFVKTTERERLVAGVRRTVDYRELQRENVLLRDRILSDELDRPEAFGEIVTSNSKMRAIFKYVETVAETSQPVLITGESGTGKELIARCVHDLSGREGKFVAVNAASLDDNAFSDTLFGHVKGAFTGADAVRKGLVEEADGGTLFLDEIGGLSEASQIKLLRLLQEREYYPLGVDTPRQSETRIVAATLEDLISLREARQFRADLYYRLLTHQVHIPPLRDRIDDLPLLLNHFLEEASKTLGKKKPTPPKELRDLLATYCFPGNVRELRSMVFDAVSSHKSHKLSMDRFKIHIHRSQTGPVVESEETDGEDQAHFAFANQLPSLKEASFSLVREAMKRSNHNQSVAAKMLGITRQALNSRLKKMDLPLGKPPV